MSEETVRVECGHCGWPTEIPAGDWTLVGGRVMFRGLLPMIVPSHPCPVEPDPAKYTLRIAPST